MNPNLKARFLTNLKVEYTLGSSVYTMLEPLAVELTEGDQEEVIAAPAGTRANGASVPHLPIVFLALGGKALFSASFHDYLYATRRFARQRCDDIFYACMIAEGVSEDDALAMYEGVRLGGRSHFGTPFPETTS